MILFKPQKGPTKQFKELFSLYPLVQAMKPLLIGFQFRSLRFVFSDFGLESVEQSVGLSNSSTVPLSKHHFFQTDNQNSLLLTVFGLLQLFFRSCVVVEVAEDNRLMPSIVSLVNFQWIQILRHQGIAFNWLSLNFFVQ